MIPQALTGMIPDKCANPGTGPESYWVWTPKGKKQTENPQDGQDPQMEVEELHARALNGSTTEFAQWGWRRNKQYRW